MTPADRAAWSAAARAERIQRDERRAADDADRAAGLYVPTPLERDYLKAGVSPAEAVARLYAVDPEDPASADRLQQHVAELTAYVERRRPELTAGQE